MSKPSRKAPPRLPREAQRLLRLSPEEIARDPQARSRLRDFAQRHLRCRRLLVRVEREALCLDARAALRAGALRGRRPAQAVVRALAAADEDDAAELAYLVEPGPGWLESLVRFVQRRFPSPLLSGHGQRLLAAVAARPGLLQSGRRDVLVALESLAARSNRWLREPEGWRPRRSSVDGQLRELLDHLVRRRPVPRVLDSAWLLGQGDAQEWDLHVGLGRSLRSAPQLPMAVSRRMGGFFQRAPLELSARAALRHAQVRTLGGSEEQALELARTRLGRHFRHEDFWTQAIRFLIGQDLPPRCYWLIVDWAHDRRFVAPEGAAGPPQPGLSLRGRSPDGLLREALRWAAARRAEERARGWTWPADPERPAWWRYGARDGLGVEHRIVQLLGTAELADEGRRLGHCVLTYARSCRAGRSSIWSLRECCPALRTVRRVATLELFRGRLVQARGRFNRGLTEDEWALVEQWRRDRDVGICRYVARARDAAGR